MHLQHQLAGILSSHNKRVLSETGCESRIAIGQLQKNAVPHVRTVPRVGYIVYKPPLRLHKWGQKLLSFQQRFNKIELVHSHQKRKQTKLNYIFFTSSFQNCRSKKKKIRMSMHHSLEWNNENSIRQKTFNSFKKSFKKEVVSKYWLGFDFFDAVGKLIESCFNYESFVVCMCFLTLNMQLKYVSDHFMLVVSFVFTLLCVNSTAYILMIFFPKLMPLGRNRNDEDKERLDACTLCLFGASGSQWVYTIGYSYVTFDRFIYRVGQKNVTTFYILTIFKLTKTFVSYPCS